jgi:hypothetical protein
MRIVTEGALDQALLPAARRDGDDGNQPMVQNDIAIGLKQILEGIAKLQKSFAHRKFTIDGRLVGDIGEIIAAAEFDIKLDDVSRSRHDGMTTDGRQVQIKATFKRSLTLTTVPDYYLGLQLEPNGTHKVIFNGPGRVIAEYYHKRQGIGVRQLSFPIARLSELSTTVAEKDRIPRRNIAKSGG